MPNSTLSFPTKHSIDIMNLMIDNHPSWTIYDLIQQYQGIVKWCTANIDKDNYQFDCVHDVEVHASGHNVSIPNTIYFRYESDLLVFRLVWG